MKNVRTFTDVTWSAGLDSPWDFINNPYDDIGTDDYWDIDVSGNTNNGYPFHCQEETLVTWNGSVDSDWHNDANWSGSLEVPSPQKNVTIPSAPANQPVISSGADCNNLTIDAGATLTIQSQASGTGSLITYGAITNNGTVNIQQYVTDGAWHLISSPNNVATASTFAGNYMQNWDETTATWTDIVEPTTPLVPAKGYSLWGTTAKATTYTFTGTPNTGNQNMAVTYTSNGSENIGANLLGNPFPSSIDWSGLDDTWGAVYYYNGTGYDSWNNGAGSGSQYVPPMQGFFVVVGGAGNFELDNGDRAHNIQPYYKSVKNNILVLETKSKNYSDKLYIGIDEAANPDFDLKQDAYKFMSGTGGLSELYSFSGDKILSIDVRPECSTIQLGFNNSEAGFYNIGICDVAAIEEATLEDTKTNTFHDLTKSSYHFSWGAGDDEKRFKLHLNQVGVEESVDNENDILIYASGKQVSVKSRENGEVVILDVTGRVVLRKAIAGLTLNTISTNLKSGMYVVAVVSGGSRVARRVFIK
jgi:hypothetical protein